MVRLSAEAEAQAICYAKNYPDLLHSYCTNANVSLCYTPGLDWHWNNVGKAKGWSNVCLEKNEPASWHCYAQNYPSLLAEFCANDVAKCDVDGLKSHWRHVSQPTWTDIQVECPPSQENLRCYAENYGEVRAEYCPGAATTATPVAGVDCYRDDLSTCDLEGLKWHW